MSGGGAPAPAAVHRVLVGYDGSASSARAVRFALGLLDSGPRQLWLVYASDAPRTVAEPRTEEEQRTETSAIGENLRAIAAERDPGGQRIHALVREGPPAQVLLAVAHEVGADLIVVGTRGLRGAARFFLGSVSQAVVAEAPCPVTIVP